MFTTLVVFFGVVVFGPLAALGWFLRGKQKDDSGE